MEIIKGNLISLALEGRFDVIGHGCNCFCKMKRGIAPQMVKAFGCDSFELEHKNRVGDINKLGGIDYVGFHLKNGVATETLYVEHGELIVVNMYTQYHWVEPSRFDIPLDYAALELCLLKMNHVFKGKHIGLPRIGCGLAGGNWTQVLVMIYGILTDCKVTIVEYEN